MPIKKTRSHKHFRLDAVKIKRAQKVLRASTETEAIERALDFVISEHQRNRLASQANDRLVKSGIAVRMSTAHWNRRCSPSFSTSL